MKKIITFCLVVIGMVAKAQTLDKGYDYSPLYSKLNSTEDAFSYYDEISKQFKVYSTNNSLLKTVSVNINDSTFIGLYLVSKTIINNDGKLKFGFATYNNKGKYTFKIADENGNIIFSKDSAYFPQIYNTNNGVKMRLQYVRTNNPRFEVYNLGGTFLGKKEIDNEAVESLPYPNPTTDLIYLELTKGNLVVTNINGAEVESLAVTGSILYDTTKLVPGLYFYNLNGLNKGKFIKQ